MWAKIIGVAGIVIELVGFVILARELLRTNRDVVVYAKSLAGAKTTAATITGYDGPDGYIEFSGGSLGGVSPAAEQLAQQVEAGAKATWLGLILTAIGVVAQLTGTLCG